MQDSNISSTVSQDINNNTNIPEELKELHQALAERNVSLCVPKIPEGFEVADSFLYIDPTTDNVDFSILYVRESNHIGFDLIQTDNPAAMYEKDSTEVEEYQYAGVTHYIFSNITDTVAVWNVDSITYSIATDMSSINMKEFIQSIYKE